MSKSRRKFIKDAGLASAGIMAAGGLQAAPFNIIRNLKNSPNDKIRIATIGVGIQGHFDTKSALNVDGTELVAVADLYDDRLVRAKEVFGSDIATTRDYREILARDDVDAVLIVTPDHWHDTISIDAMRAGKHVYCEKPMVQHIDEGSDVIKAWKDTGMTMQVGSQRISSSVFAEARRLLSEGVIGEINFIEANYDRFDAIGAWNYTIPGDASPSNLDWDAFLKDTPKRSFDAKRFFRWRNYRDYGTGVAGDLFVHLITGVHYALNTYGPTEIYSAGNLAYWNDGRDVPDVMVSTFNYPKTDQHAAFQMVLRVNFANAGNIDNSTRIIGSDGEMVIGWNNLKITKRSLPKAPGIGGYDSLFTFSEDQQEKIKASYDSMYSSEDRKAPPAETETYNAPSGQNDHVAHFQNFFDHVRKGSQGTIEGPEFGFRAAAPVLACNKSYFDGKIVYWDPDAMKVKKKK